MNSLMKLIVRFAGSVALLVVAGFCLFGFLASFEPLPPIQQWTWRVVYAVLGGASLGGVFWLWRARNPNRRTAKRNAADRLAALALFAGGAVWLAGCVPPGRMVLSMEVYDHEQLVLRTRFDAPDREGPADLWHRAGMEPSASDDQLAPLKADLKDPLRATLTGAVRVSILHVDRLMTSATLTNLVLLRKSAESRQWFLAPEQVQRASKAAGQ